MDNMILMLLILLLCVPGILLMNRHTVTTLLAESNHNLTSAQAYALVTLQTLIMLGFSLAVGVYLGPKVGITDEFLKGLGHGELLWKQLADQVVVAVPAGIICSLIWVGAYYAFVRKKMDHNTLTITEDLRYKLGLSTRVFSGGIVEEVLFRWGLLTFVMWLITFTSMPKTINFWISITITGVIFGLAHLPGNLSAGVKPSKILYSVAIFGNLWVSLFCGYLLWQYGLVAAIIVHMLFHIVWYPFEVRVRNKLI